MIAYHNSHDPACRTPFGAAAVHTSLTLALYLSDAPGYSCSLRLWQEPKGEHLLPMQVQVLPDGRVRYACTFDVPDEPCLLWYLFRLTAPDGSVCYYGNQPDGLGGEGALSSVLPLSYQVTVYQPAPVPDWYRQAVVYQIFPDRFARGKDWQQRYFDALPPEGWVGAPRVLQGWNDTPFYTRDAERNVTRWGFFGGTLEGVREKLPYLKSLGVTAVYLNPIFEAYSNHKYDTANYLRVDPGLGDEDGFRRLAAEAKECGIRLILDGVFNHTGADSIYFNRYGNYDASGACQGEASPYYDWFHFRSFPAEYEAWWGVKDLPAVNEENPAYRAYIFGDRDSVVRHWLRRGASGWRLDVADELPDSFIEALRAALKEEDPDALLLGEVWEDASNKRSYGEQRRYLLGRELDATMHYPFRTAMLDFFLFRADAASVCRRMKSLQENYPPEHFYAALNLIGSHDRMRILTLLSGVSEELPEAEQENLRLTADQRSVALRRLRALSTLQFTSAGVPCIFYGDEAGLEGGNDPYNRAPFPWGHEDTALTEHYRALTALRKAHPALVDGGYEPVSFGTDVCGWLRRSPEETLLCLANRADTPRSFDPGAPHSLLFGTLDENGSLPPYGFCVLSCEE